MGGFSGIREFGVGWGGNIAVCKDSEIVKAVAELAQSEE
jgi:hypothetical protein